MSESEEESTFKYTSPYLYANLQPPLPFSIQLTPDLFDDIGIATSDEVEEASRYDASFLSFPPEPVTPLIASFAANVTHSENSDPMFHATAHPTISTGPGPDALTHPEEDSSNPFVLPRCALRRTGDDNDSSHSLGNTTSANSSSVSVIFTHPSVAVRDLRPYFHTHDTYIGGDNLHALDLGFATGDMDVEIAQVSSDVVPFAPELINTFPEISVGANLVEENQRVQWPNTTFASDTNMSEVEYNFSLGSSGSHAALFGSYVDNNPRPLMQYLKDITTISHLTTTSDLRSGSANEDTMMIDTQELDFDFDVLIPGVAQSVFHGLSNHIAQNTPRSVLLDDFPQSAAPEPLRYHDTRATPMTASSLTVNGSIDTCGLTAFRLGEPVFRGQMIGGNFAYRERFGPLTPKTAAFLDELDNTWPSGEYQLPSDAEVANDSRYTILDEAPIEESVLFQDFQETPPISEDLMEAEQISNFQLSLIQKPPKSQKVYQSVFRLGPMKRTSDSIDPVPAKRHRTRRVLKKIERGNNAFGRCGIEKCEACRKRKGKCVFTKQWRICQYCRENNVVSPCYKIWGDKKQSSLDPPCRPAMPADAVIEPEEVLLLQSYCCSERRINKAAPVLGVRLVTCLVSVFGPAIDNGPLCYTMLAFAEKFLPDLSAARCRRYIEKAYSALLQKPEELWTEKDTLAAICLSLPSPVSIDTGSTFKLYGRHYNAYVDCNTLFSSIIQQLEVKEFGFEVPTAFRPTVTLVRSISPFVLWGLESPLITSGLLGCGFDIPTLEEVLKELIAAIFNSNKEFWRKKRIYKNGNMAWNCYVWEGVKYYRRVFLVMEKEVDDDRDRRNELLCAEIVRYTLSTWSMMPPLLDDFVLSIDVILQSCKKWSHLAGLAVELNWVVLECTDWGNVFLTILKSAVSLGREIEMLDVKDRVLS